MTAAQADKAPSTVTNGEPDESPTSTASSNFEQLVRDTENAFDAVNSALVEMRAIRASHASSPSLPPTPPPKDPARSVPPKSAARTARQPSLPPRRKSTKSVKSQKSQKSLKSRTSPPRRKATTASRASSKKAGRRWGIPGNMSDLFSMRMFQKIEADEVVTPIQIEAFKIRKMSLALAEQEVQEREKAAGSRSSLESMLPDQSESSNGSSTGPRTPPLVDSPSSIYSSDEPTRTALSLATVNSTAKDLDGRLSDDEPGFTFLDDSTPSECGSPVFTSQEELPSLPSPPPPLPPAKNPLRSALARKKLSPLLPSLPEDSEASAMISEPPSSSSSRGSGDFVYLPSTPCTLTAPRFRHGHIRVSRPPMPQDGIMGFDDGLDWTAFQMAIQGGAGDWYSENEETTRRREADEAKDVVAWWTTWNFESAGALVSADQKNPDATVQPSDGSGSGSGRSSMDSSENADSFTCLSDGSDEHDEDEDDDEEDVDELSDDLAAYSLSPSNPYNAHRKWRNADDTDDSASATRRLEIDTSKQVLMLDATAAAEGLQVVHNSSSDNVDFVPMGCNLTSDLGDFLRWEAEYAFAGNFYSGPTR
ncbi:uncharacterized protein B0I36DRAFT_327269 [Microdochium trichocladiopsis]|uniref:Uncharacterized protein n=1 Tax=Microdochium trichocladiopsis TaxID=1682393 RepID=A0A9P9BNA7_9PEZI|nr:uncharacterized protein B0I36DRAFT_327269 [Microdochium trichocladiopsis]KAH7027521.1 hypothetical protein B0I36DRAFT_327269 [Microdochium trichocladiopsis]